MRVRTLPILGVMTLCIGCEADRRVQAPMRAPVEAQPASDRARSGDPRVTTNVDTLEVRTSTLVTDRPTHSRTEMEDDISITHTMICQLGCVNYLSELNAFLAKPRRQVSCENVYYWGEVRAAKGGATAWRLAFNNTGKIVDDGRNCWAYEGTIDRALAAIIPDEF